MDIELPIKTDEQMPEYATEHSAGADVRAHLDAPLTLEPGCSAIVPTSLFCEIPPGYEIQVRPRSGLAAKNQVTVLNTPGTVDADYRGEIKVILINHGKRPFVVEPKMRIAQLVVAKVERARFIRAEVIGATARGDGGFGHTGVD